MDSADHEYSRFLAIAALLWLPLAHANIFDTVIVGGQDMGRQTGLDAKRSVGIHGGRVETITKSRVKGRQEIEATDLVVTAVAGQPVRFPLLDSQAMVN